MYFNVVVFFEEILDLIFMIEILSLLLILVFFFSFTYLLWIDEWLMNFFEEILDLVFMI